MTQTGMVVGTPQYLSPEQALGRGVDARSDLYSVGIMLFQLVTGRLPFDADSPLAIAYAHVQEEPVAPSSVNRSLPPAVDALVARALKKNPNERFPSAESMRDECLRVAQSFQAAAPSIVPGAQTSSGAGVGSAVFPPVDQTPPGLSGNVQTPYTPGPYGPPAPAPASTPPPSPSYGYPQQGGYQTPPQTAAYSPQQGLSTPPPYTISPQPTTPASGGGRKSNTPVIIGSIVVALAAVGGLIAALTLNGGSNTEGGGGGDATASASEVAGHRGPDTTKTIEAEECSEPEESYNDPEKIKVPDFTYKNLDSVKKCLQAAGWEYEKKDVNENTYGEDTVMQQIPAADTDVDPKEMPKIQLYVSTGDPA
jgi:hypothetical protein